MADEAETTETGNEGTAFDLGSIIPETFKGEDGKWDTDGFKASYDSLSAFKAQADERAAGLPEKPEDYPFLLPDDFQLPEGFDADAMKTVDDKGNEVAFDPATLIDPKDPDIPALQGLMHEMALGNIAPTDAIRKLAGMVATRELRAVQDAMNAAKAETEALGPQAKQRISTVTRALEGKLPAAQAKALADSLTSADALRGIEAILRPGGGGPSPAPGNQSYSDMNPMERVMAGLNQRKSA